MTLWWPMQKRQLFCSQLERFTARKVTHTHHTYTLSIFGQFLTPLYKTKALRGSGTLVQILIIARTTPNPTNLDEMFTNINFERSHWHLGYSRQYHKHKKYAPATLGTGTDTDTGRWRRHVLVVAAGDRSAADALGAARTRSTSAARGGVLIGAVAGAVAAGAAACRGALVVGIA